MKPLCIYHANCLDGFTAAWVVRRYFGPDGVDFHPGVYQDPPPNCLGRDVIFVDFSYKRPEMLKIIDQAATVTILDHHKSAAEDLSDLIDGDRVCGCFDMDRSGAVLAWDWFLGERSRPALLAHIQDRDLWRFHLPQTREINAALFSYSYDFDTWDKLMQTSLDSLAEAGAAIERKHHKDVAELVGVTRRRMRIGGYDVPVANLPYVFVSDAAHLMAKGEPFAACYWDTPDGRVFGLRSTEEGIDVSEIAKLYGGGGHKRAAGFRVALGWEGDDA